MKRLLSRSNEFLIGMISLVAILIVSCKQRDDYPDFSGLEAEAPVEDIIPPDNNMTPLVQKIKDGAPFYKTFLIDSTISIANGVEYYHTRFINSLDQKVSMHIVELDLNKANILLSSLTPYDDYLFGSQQLPEMMQMNQETIAGDILVGIVGDGSTPTGTFVKKGRVIKTNTSRTIPYIGVKKGSNDIAIANSPDATKFPVPAIVPTEFTSLIAGVNWMLYLGTDVVYTTTTTVARTAVGFTLDKKIYCISVDGVNDFSAGISLNNMRTIFKALACNNAFYVNGSASNALAVKQGDKWILKSIPQTGVAPAVGTGIGFVMKK